MVAWRRKDRARGRPSPMSLHKLGEECVCLQDSMGSPVPHVHAQARGGMCVYKTEHGVDPPSYPQTS